MDGWLDWLREVSPQEPAALVSVLATEGSAPRGAGTRMLVTPTRLLGTIGGGQLERRAIDQAQAMLAQPPGSWRVQDYPLGPLLGQCCGGRVRLLVEHVDPGALGWLAEDGDWLVTILGRDGVQRARAARETAASPSARGERPGAGARLVEPVAAASRPLYLFGAGHVGKAVARHVAGLPFSLAWFDTRDEVAAVDGVTRVDEDAVPGCLVDAPPEAAVLILTHDHGLDYRLVLAALTRLPLAFVGLIGSATKRARFLQRLERDGVPAASRARLTSPIGVAGVAGKEPDVIAVAVLAQLLQLGRP